MSKAKEKHPRLLKIISTVIYVLLMVALVVIRFPVTVDRVVLHYSDTAPRISEQLDAHGNPVVPGLTLMYDCGEGYVHEGKLNGKQATITNEIRGVLSDNQIVFTVYQDGDPTLLTNFNSLVGMKKWRLCVSEAQPVAVSSLEFKNGSHTVRTITAQDLQKYFLASNTLSLSLASNGDLVLTSAGDDAYLEVDTSIGSWFYRTFHTFSFANIALMLIFTAIYLIVGHGHQMVNRLQEKLLQ